MKKLVFLLLLIVSSVGVIIPTTTHAATNDVAACQGLEIDDRCSYTQTANTSSGRVTLNGRCQQGGFRLYCNTGAVPESERVGPGAGSQSNETDGPGGGSEGNETEGPGSGSDPNTSSDASSPQQVSFQNPSRFTSIPELLAGIVNAALGLLGGLAVILIVFSGIKYMMSSNPGDVAKATEGIRNAIVGLMVVMGAYLIVQFVISALV